MMRVLGHLLKKGHRNYSIQKNQIMKSKQEVMIYLHKVWENKSFLQETFYFNNTMSFSGIPSLPKSVAIWYAWNFPHVQYDLLVLPG